MEKKGTKGEGDANCKWERRKKLQNNQHMKNEGKQESQLRRRKQMRRNRGRESTGKGEAMRPKF